jgi:general secretion pathway protein L
MTSLARIVEGCGRWIDSVAGTLVAAAGSLTFPRAVEVVEDEGGAFVLRVGKNALVDSSVERLQIANDGIVGPVSEKAAAMLRGSRAELILRPSRFLFRPLELPRRAAEFLDGVVRAQIDRLTPWSAGDAAFGCSQPAELAPDRIVVTVAATARTQVAPYVQALARLGAESISVSTVGEDSKGRSAPIKVLEEKMRTPLDVARVRFILAAVLVLAVLAAAVSAGAAVIIGGDLGARQDDLARKIAQRRVAIRAGDGTGLAISPLHKLELRKHETPSSVIALEVLSQILPDHTYVTELRIEGDKLRLTGVTRDAPSLIRLIEQSSHFTRATFFAPTTRQPSDPGERFHIEARIEPVFSPRS